MKLELSVSKRQVDRATGSKEEIIFAVVDSAKSERYPLNFVCLLPKTLESREYNPANNFLRIYGKESSKIAIKLLTNALNSERDLKVKNEIEKRLKALQPKPIPNAKCPICGNTFTPKKFGRFSQRFCEPCRAKNSGNL